MKTRTQPAAKRAASTDELTKQIAGALRRARTKAVKTARMHNAPIIYKSNGKIISERP